MPLTYPALLNLIASLICLIFGVAVFLRNTQKPTHRAFFLLAINLCLWALGVAFIVESHDEQIARVGMTITFIIACFLPATFYQFIGLFPRDRFEGSRITYWTCYTLAVILSVGAFTRFHIVSITVSPNGPPTAIYGPVFQTYGLLIISSWFMAFANLTRKLWTSSGIERRQIQHVMLGIFASTFLAIATNVLAPLMSTDSLEPYGPTFSLIMVAIFAYAMIRYHLLDIWLIFSRTTLYTFVTSFVVLVFWASVSVVHLMVTEGMAGRLFSTALAALVVALVLNPLKESAQLFLDRLLVKRHYDANALLARLSQHASEIVHLDELLSTVVKDIQQTLGIDVVRVLLSESDDDRAFKTAYSTVSEERGQEIRNLDSLIERAQRVPEPIALEMLVHTGDSVRDKDVIEQLRLLDAHLCIALRTKTKLLGIMTLGPKLSGDIYTSVDLVLFQALTGPLATAIENARLYRKLEEANLHREMILSVMKGGVIAVDPAGKVASVNASAIATLGAIEIGQDITTLALPVANLLRKTLLERTHITDFETVVDAPDGDRIHVAMSSSRLVTAEGELKGAMAMIYDLTQLKRLEQHVARADQLSSIGTLAAGMAHEIKNPLVSIKTMTQLLLLKYDDPDFRSTFTDIVPHEVERIDSIVSGLLDFARPKPTSYAQHDIRIIVEKVIMLLDSQILKHNITLIVEFPDEVMPIYGDEQQLHQVFLNLGLNAIDAMKDSPTRVLRVRGAIETVHLSARDYLTVPDVECVRIIFADTGCGIPNESISHLFTPFFTTKPHGCGLGLSVAHGIIKEHGGMIDARSRPNDGAVFEVTLPVVGAAQAVRER